MFLKTRDSGQWNEKKQGLEKHLERCVMSKEPQDTSTSGKCLHRKTMEG